MHGFWRRTICGLGITAAGCATASRSSAPSPNIGNLARNDVAREERTSLVSASGVALSSLPLVRGTIAGKPTLMAVDTGSGANVIAGWLARSLELRTTKVAEPTHDPSGNAILMDRDDQPAIVVDGFDPLRDRPTLVVDLPPAFEAAGIGGILSPQMLASPVLTVVLDMPAHEMRRVRSSSPANAGSTGSVLSTDGAAICNQSGAGFEGKMLSMRSEIDGVPTRLAVDTGAIGSAFFVTADSDAARKVLSRGDGAHESGFSAAGKLDVTTAHDVAVRVGPREWKSDVTVMPGRRDSCGTEGRLGLDYLTGCVISIRDRSYDLHCR